MSAIPHNYDDVPYPGHTYAESHPAHVATVATLLGLTPPDVQTCRVLELGCANGVNLIAIAADLPHSTCVGVDMSVRQIAVAQTQAHALGVSNVTFTALDVREIDAAWGQFDYVIAHGLFSWVPPDVQEHILRVCAQNLAPHGIAYISYNAYPGWHMAETLRNLLLYRLRGVTAPHERAKQAIALLDTLIGAPEQNFIYDSSLVAYAQMIKHKLDALGPHRESFLLHDLLEEFNAPCYFHEFAARAAAHGLQYLAEAALPNVFPHEFTPDMTAYLQTLSGDVLDLEQYMDFLRGRMFRRTLLCHAALSFRRTVSPQRMMNMVVAGRAVPVTDQPNITSSDAETFGGADGAKITLDHPPSKAAFAYLAASWPAALPFDTLLQAAYMWLDQPPADQAQDAYLLAANLLKAYCYSPSLITLRVTPVLATSTISERPTARPLARLQAQHSSEVTNAYHESIALDPLGVALLPLLDGSRDRTTLADALAVQINARQLDLALPFDAQADKAELHFLIQAEIEGQLRWLSKSGLLIA